MGGGETGISGIGVGRSFIVVARELMIWRRIWAKALCRARGALGFSWYVFRTVLVGLRSSRRVASGIVKPARHAVCHNSKKWQCHAVVWLSSDNAVAPVPENARSLVLDCSMLRSSAPLQALSYWVKNAREKARPHEVFVVFRCRC